MPMFLFRDGLLTLMYKASDGSHEALFLSPHNAKILYRDLVTSGFMMVKYWGGALRCSMNLSPNVLDDSSSVMMNTLVNHPEHLERGSKHISRPPPQYWIIIKPLVTKSIENFSIVGREEQNLTRAIRGFIHKGQ